MTAFIATFVLLCIGHFVADYPLQSEFIAKGKNRFRPVDLATVPPGQVPQTIWPWVLTAHAATHGAAVFIITQSVPLAVAETVSHWLIDYGKCANRYGIHTDQLLHIACKYLWATILAWPAA